MKELKNSFYQLILSCDNTIQHCRRLNFVSISFNRYVKTRAFEVQIADDLRANENLSPRFLNDIDDEIDVLEDKKAPLFSNYSNCVF